MSMQAGYAASRPGAADASAALSIEGLSVGYERAGGDVNPVVWELDLALGAGKIMGLAGESGCGKSTAALAAIGYRPPGLEILGGRSMLGDLDLLALSHPRLKALWGRRIVYVAQQASTALNPAITVGKQLAQPLTVHLGLRGDALLRRQLELLELVDIPDPPSALKRYSFQFSGGQQQRIAIAIALSCAPEILILDEPTTGLDVTTQARFSALLKAIVAETQVATLYVSHDLALLHTVADTVTVMYAGQVAETGRTSVVLRRPSHPYTEALLLAAPSAQRPGLLAGIPGRPPSSVVLDACSYAPRCSYVVPACTAGPVALHDVDEHLVRCIRAATVTRHQPNVAELPRAPAGAPLLDVEGVWCTYRNAARPVVRDVTLTVMGGETIGIVGESGSGKSTLLRAIAGLHTPSAGAIRFRGRELEPRAVKRPRALRRELQLIFQDPDSSLNPRHTVESLLARPIRLFREEVSRAAETQVAIELLDAVKLSRNILHRYPSELSGGQKQRVAIARAFAAKPSVLLCDEVTSALDVSVQATILELIAELSIELSTAVIFVSHDLAVVRSIASRAVVMRDGEVCEQGRTDHLFSDPQHPYTQTLLASVPELPAM